MVDTFNLALYDSDATLNKSTTVYTTSEELATTGGYTAKGKALTSVTPVLDSDTAVCDFANYKLDFSFIHCARLFNF